MPTTLTPSTEPPATANHTSETTVAATETTEAQTSQVVTTLSPTHASISSLDNDAYRHEGSFQSVIFALQRRRSKAPPKVNRAPDSPMTTEAPEVLVTTPDIATTSTTSSTQVFKMRNDLSLRPRKRLVRVMKVKPNRRWSSMRPSFRTDRVQIHETDYNLKKIVFVLSAH
ncbi:hypothetical protein HDE_00743 [Halotydeus destructor]|nr:hypothetical protein HDE_00743 [Halotydeus destructor]